MRRLFALALFAQIFAAPILAPVFAGGATPALLRRTKGDGRSETAGPSCGQGASDLAGAPDETAAARMPPPRSSTPPSRASTRSSAAVGNPSLDDAELSRQAAAIGPISAKIQDVLAKATPRQAAIKARLDQLGPAPDPKANPPVAPGDPAVAKDRADQTKIFTAVDDVIKRANLLELRGRTDCTGDRRPPPRPVRPGGFPEFVEHCLALALARRGARNAAGAGQRPIGPLPIFPSAPPTASPTARP